VIALGGSSFDGTVQMHPWKDESTWMRLSVGLLAVALLIAFSLDFHRINILHSAVNDPLFAICVILATIAWGCRR